jgi:hypothetical protein
VNSILWCFVTDRFISERKININSAVTRLQFAITSCSFINHVSVNIQFQFNAGFLLGLLFELEDGGDMLLRSVGCLSNTKTSYATPICSSNCINIQQKTKWTYFRIAVYTNEQGRLGHIEP